MEETGTEGQVESEAVGSPGMKKICFQKGDAGRKAEYARNGWEKTKEPLLRNRKGHQDGFTASEKRSSGGLTKRSRRRHLPCSDDQIAEIR
eukprot:1855390-Pleurochrysis_carterae.AAC.1